jgi:DNA-binding CsgD family transcriptional regulator
MTKGQLRTDILAMLQQGMSYRQIGAQLGIHWSRVQ